MTNRTLPATLATLSVLALAGQLAAGPLNPPAGPVASSMKPLTDVEPRIAINATNTPGDADSVFKITSPGSYYLTGNISNVPAGKKGIEIAISDVTIDLNGYSIQGFLAQNLDGIAVESSPVQRRNIVIRNGDVVQCGGAGINLATATSCAVESIHAVNNTGSGILAGDGARVIGCTASNNSGGTGIQVGEASTVTQCVARANGLNGVFAASRCIVAGCTASGNAAYGVAVQFGSAISDCVTSGNGTHGVAAGSSCTIERCTSTSNGSMGISASAGCAITTCTASLNSVYGIDAADSCTITGCAANQNSSDGLVVGTGSVVSACTARSNTSDGIVAGAQCHIVFNLCVSNGAGGNGAGIHITGSDCRIEGNNCSGADYGIQVPFSGNLIIKNSCSGNTTNWSFAAGNAYGPIIASPSGAAVSGNTATAALGTTDPNANFSY